VRIGQLDRQVTIQMRSEVLDEFGQRSLVWTDAATVWANIRTVSGRDQEQALAVETALTHTVAIRYRIDFALPSKANLMRLRYRTPAGERILNVEALRDLDEDHDWLILSCVETSPEGVPD
jgi:SPP1 family predicted phage head-tail adaptor